MFGSFARNLLPAALLGAFWHIPFLVFGLLFAAGPALAAPANVDGLPLPRFVTTHFNNVNVRVGPGERYDVTWVFTSAGTPVEVVQEFDIWRKIRDFDGQEGWIQQNQLSGIRAGLVSPGKSGSDFALFSSPSVEASPRAYLPPGFRVNLKRCDGSWCQVDATGRDTGGHSSTYSGYLKQGDIWGVLQGEVF